MTPRAVAIFLMCAHVIAGATIVAVGEAATSGDFNRYYEIGSTAGQPYVDFQVEHAPLTLGLFRTLARTLGSRRRFGTAMVAIDVAANLLIALTLAWTFEWTAAAVYLITSLVLSAILDTRFDLLPTLAATLAMAAHVRRKPATAIVALVTGIGFKLWPLCLLPFVLRRLRGADLRRALTALACASIALAAVWLSIGGLAGVRQVVTFRGASGWQIESWMGLFSIARGEHPRDESGASRIAHISPIVSVAFLAVGTIAALAIAWRGAGSERPRIGVTWLASVATLLTCSPLFSPQFMVWLAPAAAIAWVEGDQVPAALTALATLLTAIFMVRYGFVVDGYVWALSMLFMRNLLVLVILLMAAARSTRAVRRLVLVRGHQPVFDERQ